jgi:hypothetical protein
MIGIPVNLAIEDELSEVVLLRILGYLRRYAVGAAHRRGGYGYLKTTIPAWNRAAKGVPIVVLTDLDDWACPAELMANWLTAPRHQNLIFRVAVREVESWLLADRENFSRFLAVREALIPTNSDGLADPKAALVSAASRSRSRVIRDRIVPRPGSTAKQGPDYNACLGLFVRDQWDIRSARINSPSLARTIDRLSGFNPVWERPR